MSAEPTTIRHVSVIRPTTHDMSLAVHAAHGVFAVLDMIDNGKLDELGQDDLGDLRSEMIIAGRLLTRGLLDRL